jgi:hypothetical protein
VRNVQDRFLLWSRCRYVATREEMGSVDRYRPVRVEKSN